MPRSGYCTVTNDSVNGLTGRVFHGDRTASSRAAL